ncbi:MAG: acyl carrier protein [Myxococcota bacterium]|nr:acyl carrier protein [Myxococcota bacterium]
MDDAAIEASLLAFFSDVLRLDVAPIGRDLELLSGGYVDSMDLVRIAAHLEQLIDLEIPDEDIHDDHFGSTGRILAYVASRRA